MSLINELSRMSSTYVKRTANRQAYVPEKERSVPILLEKEQK